MEKRSLHVPSGHTVRYGHTRIRPLRTGLSSVKFATGQHVQIRGPKFNLKAPAKVRIGSPFSNVKFNVPDLNFSFARDLNIRSQLRDFQISAPDVNLGIAQHVQLGGPSHVQLRGPDLHIRGARKVKLRVLPHLHL